VVAAVLICSCTGLWADTSINQIVTLDAEPSYSRRHHALHHLSAAKLSGYAPLLIDFMCAEQVPEGMREVDYMSLVNDIYNLLLSNGTEVQQLFNICLEVIPDKSAGLIWRDYCMQKFNYTLGREDLSSESIQQALVLLDAATTGAYPRIQGTAFTAAYQYRNHPFEPKPDFLNETILGERALTAAKNESIPLIDRITALQTAGKCRAVGTLPFALMLLDETSAEAVMLQVAAIATIGDLGSAEHLDLLYQFRLSPDVRIRTATRSAIQCIQSRI
jgi:hypothetical protein